MLKNTYLNTAIASFIAFSLLLIMFFTWPLTEFSLYDVILENVKLSDTEKNEVITSIGVNYALDTIFIFCWIASWLGLYLYFKSQNIKFVDIYFGLSLLGALLDLSENSISFSLLVGNFDNPKNFLLIHAFVRDISYWLPMLASFLLVVNLPKQKGLSILMLKFIGIIGVLFAILGMYIQFFSSIPDYWFALWFLSATWVLLNAYKKENANTNR